MKRYKIVLLLLLVVAAAFVVYQQKTAPYREAHGSVFGTFYNITYQHTDDLQEEILAALGKVDSSMSMFNPKSTIARINRGETDEVDGAINYLFPRAMAVSEATDGAFDITVAPLVNAWGFGFKKGEWPTDEAIDSIMQCVGYRKVELKARRLVRQNPKTMIDFSAIAKGYGVDMVARVLDKAKVENYMVEIGGEVVVKGHNNKGNLWRIGISKPTTDKEAQKAFQCVVELKNCAAATSGNYRNFYIKDGKKYAHTIDPRTGRTVQHDVVSATIIARQCYEADAYATACMVMGLGKAKEAINANKNLEAYLIYIDADGELKPWCSTGFEKYIVK